MANGGRARDRKSVLSARSWSIAATDGGERELAAGISLYANAVKVTIYCSIDKINALFSLIETDFKIDCWRAVVATVFGAPFDIEDSVGSHAAYRCEDALATSRIVCEEIGRTGRDEIADSVVRQTEIVIAVAGVREGEVTVRAHVERSKNLIIENYRKRQWNIIGQAIVTMVSNVACARHDRRASRCCNDVIRRRCESRARGGE